MTGLPVVHRIEPGGGPVLVFGGPYGNLQATEALLAAARARGIPPTRTICTGDSVAYGADAAATVALIRDAGIAVVKGNVEESLGAGAADCGCGFAAGSACDLLAAKWYAHAVATLDAGARRWMARLPDRIDLGLGRLKLAVVHGAPSSINRFLFPGHGDADLAAELDRLDVDGVVAGHSGVPFARRIGRRLWCNAGAIGLPANDGTPRVWYAILEAVDGGIDVDFHALVYDHAAAARAIRDVDLPPAYADTLATGLWPSDEVMPEADRRRRGVALRPPTTRFRPAAAPRRISA